MPNEILTPTRRQTLALTAGGLIASLIGPRSGAYAAAGDTLTIAYNVNLPSFDPTVGPSAVNPTIQAIYRSVFDQYIGQKPNLAFEPGLLTAWGWNDDKTKIWMDVRPGVTWHDGSPFTPADIVWSFERAGKKETGNPIEFVWSTLPENRITRCPLFRGKVTGDRTPDGVQDFLARMCWDADQVGDDPGLRRDRLCRLT